MACQQIEVAEVLLNPGDHVIATEGSGSEVCVCWCVCVCVCVHERSVCVWGVGSEEGKQLV